MYSNTSNNILNFKNTSKALLKRIKPPYIAKLL